MISFIKRLFTSQEEQSPIKSITYSERDENGNVDVYINDIKSNVKLHVWDENDVKKLQEIAKRIHNESN